MNKIIIICGPTASGKSALAIELAKKLNTEIISADSMYVYKNLNVGTAKPTIEEMDGIIHHLIDVVAPKDNFSVADYRNLAQPIIDDLLMQNKTPIICGGTGFYINSILYDLSYGNSSANLVARDEYKQLAEEHGNKYVYDILTELDPESASKLHYNDLKRVIRALEIYESGTKKSSITDELIPKYDFSAFMIDFPRETLYERINLRVDQMFDSGLIDEIDSLLKQGITSDYQCMQAIGYKEVLDYFNGLISLDQAKELIKLNTRHYAKRQITFFKKLDPIKLMPDAVENLASKIINQL